MTNTHCAVCGAIMPEHIDERTNKPLKIQLCSKDCIIAAWQNVRQSLKKGVRPKWTHSEKTEVVAKVQKNNKRYKYHNDIVRLYEKGLTIEEIGKELKISRATVYGSINDFGTKMI